MHLAPAGPVCGCGFAVRAPEFEPPYVVSGVLHAGRLVRAMGFEPVLYSFFLMRVNGRTDCFRGRVIHTNLHLAGWFCLLPMTNSTVVAVSWSFVASLVGEMCRIW